MLILSTLKFTKMEKNKISFFSYKRENIIIISLSIIEVLGSRGVNLDDSIKVNFTCESRVESSYAMNPIPRNVPIYNVKIRLGSISPLFGRLLSIDGLDKSINIQGTIEGIVGHDLKFL